MHLLLYTAYLFVFIFLILKLPFFQLQQFPRFVVPLLYLVKVGAGSAYGRFYMLPKYYLTADTWNFFKASLAETRWLRSSPGAFIKDLFSYSYTSSGGLFSGSNSYWNDLRSALMIKLIAVVNLFTGSSYYTGILFFNFFFLIGLVALLRLVLVFWSHSRWFALALAFLLPSTLFWCSGIHRDGLILSALGIITYVAARVITGRLYKVRYFLTLVLCLLLLFALRNYLLFALVPPLGVWFVIERCRLRPFKTFAMVYAALFVLLMVLPLIPGTINPLLFLAVRQHEFLGLQGASLVATQPLQATPQSFLQQLPHAIDMAFFRPHVNELSSLALVPAVVEVGLFILIIVAALLFFDRTRQAPPVLLFMLFFGFTVLLICGFTVPFTGAIVRYRSVVLPFFFTPLLYFVRYPARR